MLGNPVNFIDPDGQEPITLAALAIIALKGAAIGAAGYTASVGFSDGGFNNWDWGQFGKAAAIGAISGVATAGIGSSFGSVGGGMKTLGGQIAHEFGRAMVHGASNVMINAAFGNDVNAGTFGLAAASSLMGSGLHKFGDAAQLGGSTLMGGLGAELSGGDFWRGAATGATVAGLNHLMHKMTDPENQKEKKPKQQKGTGGQSGRCHNCKAKRYTKERFKEDMDNISDITNKGGVAVALGTAAMRSPSPFLKTLGIALGGTSVASGYLSNTPKSLVVADAGMFLVGFTGYGTMPAIGYGFVRSLPQTIKPNYSIRHRTRYGNP